MRRQPTCALLAVEARVRCRSAPPAASPARTPSRARVRPSLSNGPATQNEVKRPSSGPRLGPPRTPAPRDRAGASAARPPARARRAAPCALVAAPSRKRASAARSSDDIPQIRDGAEQRHHRLRPRALAARSAPGAPRRSRANRPAPSLSPAARAEPALASTTSAPSASRSVGKLPWTVQHSTGSLLDHRRCVRYGGRP